MLMTVAQALTHARALGVDRLDAQLIVAHVLSGSSEKTIMQKTQKAIIPTRPLNVVGNAV